MPLACSSPHVLPEAFAASLGVPEARLNLTSPQYWVLLPDILSPRFWSLPPSDGASPARYGLSSSLTSPQSPPPSCRLGIDGLPTPPLAQLHGPFPVASRPGHPQVPCKSKRELPPPNSPGLHFLRHRSHRVSPLASGPHLPGDPVVPQQAERCAPAGSGHGYHWRQQCGPLWAVPEFRTRERGRPVARVTCSKERDAWSHPYLPLVRSPIRERT